MTIRFTNLRTRGNEPPFEPLVFQRSATAGFNSLVASELAFGCSVVGLTQTRIETVTHVMSCVDTTIVEGTEEEMSLLVEATCLYLESQGPQQVDRYTDAIVTKVMALTKGVPLLVTIGAEMIVGTSHATRALLTMLGDPGIVGSAKKLKIDDLCAAVCLVRNDGVSAADAVSLAL